MIVKRSDKFIVIDTATKQVISEHEFEDNTKSMKEAMASAKSSNDIWKASKTTIEDKI